MKRNLIVLSSLAFLFSCGDNVSTSKNGNDVSSSVAATGDSKEEIAASLEEIEKEERMLRASTTTMSFDKMTHSFGTIKEDTENKASFVVTNTGKNPLVIEKVDVSCGCTTAKKPEKPILPGKSDVIQVVFHPKVGQLDEQKKTVTVTANTEPSIEVLNIEAFVVKK